MSKEVKFGFKKSTLGLTEEEFQAKKDEKFSKFFNTPGVYSLKIKSGEFKGFSEKDTTWAKFGYVFTDGEREIKHTVLVPTQSLLYNEGNSKRPAYMYICLRNFLAGLGIEVSSDFESISKVLPKYFSDPTTLVGKTLEAEIGYKGPYIKYLDKTAFQICKENGDLIIDEIFPSRDAAIVKGVELGLKLEQFVNIKTFLGKTAEKSPQTAVDEGVEW